MGVARTRKAIQRPTEAQEQEALFRWKAIAEKSRGELALLFHVPNGGGRSYLEGVALKRRGVQRGVPDLCLPVARGGYHGLFLELKRAGGKASPEQSQWIERLSEQGYLAIICEGWETAKSAIEVYLDLDACQASDC